LATKSEGVVLIVLAISFQDFQPMCSGSANVTDRQTDDMQSQYPCAGCAYSHTLYMYISSK